MENDAKVSKAQESYIFDCGESLPIPPGTKSKQKLWRGPGPEPTYTGWWVSGIVAALLVGVISGLLVGRFLLP